MTGVPGRTPDVVAAEKAVLGQALLSRPAAEAVCELLPRDGDFGAPLHQAVVAAIRHVLEAPGPDGRPIPYDQHAVLARLVAAEHGVWRSGQAGLILHDLTEHASPSYAAHARTVAHAAAQRRLLEALASATQFASGPGYDPDGHGPAVTDLIEAALSGHTPAPLPTAGVLFNEFTDALEAGEPPGKITWPLADLAELVPALLPGQLISVLARPSYGKSMLGHALARHAALTGQPAVLFSLEMSRAEVMARLISAHASIPHERLAARALTDDDWDRMKTAQEAFTDAPLWIDDTPAIGPGHVRARLRGLARAGTPAALAIIDYLQLMTPPEGAITGEQEIARLVGAAKAIAREHELPVVALGQLNRAPEARAGRRPYISDARGSGSWDNDSDIAILIHRPDFRDTPGGGDSTAELIVDKHRGGARGTVTVAVQPAYVRFANSTAGWTPGGAIERDELARKRAWAERRRDER